ncbi:MAG: multiheme c-type cytochrome [Pseudomonadota bacterium]|nr:multiheme c-type cytochrome [Pseudomonadota bacterium]
MTTDRPRSGVVVTPGMHRLLAALLIAFAVLVVDSVYLGTISFLEWRSGETLQGFTYQIAFLLHLALGFAIIAPALVYSFMHLRRALHRPNRLAVRLGLALFAVTLVLFVSGILLTRGLPVFELSHPVSRNIVYWLHIAAPLAACWLFVLHRLAGKRIRWGAGAAIGGISLIMSLVIVWVSTPRPPEPIVGNFEPSLARTESGHFLTTEDLMADDYCAGCHQDIFEQWQHSAHRFASFNNPAYLFSVRNTRQVAFERDGDVTAARFCAGCHDPVPLFTGAFDDPEFDDEQHETAHAGITCVSCHGITALGSPRGNSDYVIGAPEHYPFAFSQNPTLQWVNGILIKGKPALHKRTFLKPLHESAEFCGTCHKVHLPEKLNKYKWLRGQNHYDSFLLSGVSGHGVQSFYYPDQAQPNCNGCHMPWQPSDDLGAKPFEDGLAVHGHHFPAANTALASLLDFPDHVNHAHEQMLKNSMRLDIFGLRKGDSIDGTLIAPLKEQSPVLVPGENYVLDVVLRNMTVGHLFTEGTADSNQVWLSVTVTDTDTGQIIAESGDIDDQDRVHPFSHFVNAYVLDKYGQRIALRNAEDIFTKLYDHQIPPGAADVVHYLIQVPPSIKGSISIEVALHYRKFDTRYVEAFRGEPGNPLPVVTIATDQLTLPTSSEESLSIATPPSSIDAWVRWNDYGIGFLRKKDRRGLKQAESAFQKVSALNPANGYLNLGRVYLQEGRIFEAADMIRLAAEHGAYPWSVAWFSAQVDVQSGELESAIELMADIESTRFTEARERGFDFSKDYRLHVALGQARFQRGKLVTQGEPNPWFDAAMDSFKRAIDLDPENLSAHYGLTLLYERLSDDTGAQRHRTLHAKYRPDNNARDRAANIARQNDPAANQAAEPIVIYHLYPSFEQGHTRSETMKQALSHVMPPVFGHE